jgi:two-component sensor histidine kinase
MERMTQQFMRMLARRPPEPILIRLLAIFGIFVVATSGRFWLGTLHGANPALTFYPGVIMAALMLGWKEALLILTLAVILGIYFFLPPGMYLLPLAWVVVGGLNIVIISGLKSLAGQLAAANERQRILFQELQHRVANTLQAVVGAVEIAKRRIDSEPAEAARLLDDTSHRLSASADVHRRLHDPALFQKGLEAIVQDAVASVVDRRIVCVTLNVQPLYLTFDQMSTITMLVIEVANNAQKHAFQRGLGSKLNISLKASVSGMATLIVEDDGPGPYATTNRETKESGLGLPIIEGLVNQINGALRISAAGGTTVVVEFPLGH